MVMHLRRKIEPQTSAINNLILLEQFLNALNLPVICVQLARVAFPELSKSFISHYPLCISVQWLVESPNPPRKNEKRKKNPTFSEKIKNKFLPWQAEHLNLLEDRNIF